MLLSTTHYREKSRATNAKLLSYFPDAVDIGNSGLKCQYKSFSLRNQHTFQSDQIHENRSRSNVKILKENSPLCSREYATVRTTFCKARKTISVKKTRAVGSLSDAIQMAIDVGDESKDVHESYSRILANGGSRPSQNFDDERLLSVNNLQQRVTSLRNALHKTRRAVTSLSKKLKDAKESSRNSTLASSLIIHSLTRETKEVQESFRAEQTRRNIARRHSSEVVCTLKNWLSDDTDYKDELESESLWEVNMKLSIIKKTRSSLKTKQLVVRKGRHLLMDRTVLSLNKCSAITSDADDVVTSILRLVSSCNRIRKLDGLFDCTKPMVMGKVVKYSCQDEKKGSFAMN